MKAILGNEMRQFRISRGWELIELATFLNERLAKKYDKSRVSRWETGKERIPQIVAEVLRAERPPAPTGIPAAQKGPALVLTVSMQKGGVAKTTSSVAVAYLLAAKGKRVLLVDADPQGSATVALGQDPHGLEIMRKTLTAVLDANSDLPTREALVAVCEGQFQLLASSIALSEIEISMMADPTASLALREKLSEVREDFDYIVIDTPPNLGLMTASALAAADYVLIPSQTEQLSLMGIPLLMRTIDRTKRRVNRHLKVLGILPTIFTPNTIVDKMMLDELRAIAARYGVELFPPVGRAVAYKEAVTVGVPALARTPEITGADSYERIALCLIEAAAARAEESVNEPV
jgi:chromosome partitioning protein